MKELSRFLATNDNLKNMKYTREQVRNFILNPDKNERQLRELSRYLFMFSSHYRRLIGYFAKMLTLDYIITPINIDMDIINKSTFKASYSKVIKYIENYQIKDTFFEILSVLMMEDVYYGIERWNGDTFMLQRLPSDFCKISGFQNGLYTFSMDMSYFDSQKMDLNNQKIDLLANYPSEFKSLYNTYESKRGLKWQPVPSEFSVCFKFNRNLISAFPPFVQIYEEIMDLEDEKIMKKDNVKAQNFKLIWQKIPTKKEPKSEKDFVFTLPTVKKFHDGVKANLPKGIGMASTPMDLDSIDFERKVGSSSSLTNSDLHAEDELFNKAGVSKSLFQGGENNSISLNRSIQMDESDMFPLLRQFERYFKYRLETVSSAIKFKIIFPDITVYNRDDKLTAMVNLGQSGFPKSLIVATAGFDVADINSLNLLENVFLNILDNMQPLQSSHTQNGEVGKPETPESKLKPSGEKTKVTDANNKKAK